MADNSTPASGFGRIAALLNHSWTVTVMGGLLVIFLTPLMTGFANLTFSKRSWEVFGVANEVSAPGSYLAADSVYRLPVGERFRVDGDLLLAVNWGFGRPNVALTQPDGKVHRGDVSTSRSLSAEGNCRLVAVHLMRQPDPQESHIYMMYTSQRLRTESCRGFLKRLFG